MQLISLKRGRKELMSCEYNFHLPKNLPSDDLKLLYSLRVSKVCTALKYASIVSPDICLGRGMLAAL